MDSAKPQKSGFRASLVQISFSTNPSKSSKYPRGRELLKLTFQHFDCNLGHTVGLLFVETQGLSHHHLTEAAFTQWLPKNKSVVVGGGEDMSFKVSGVQLQSCVVCEVRPFIFKL